MRIDKLPKKLFVVLTIAIVLIALNAWATADGPDCWSVRGVAKNDVLNIREAPNASAKIVGKIPAGTKAVANANDIECPDVITKGAPKECFTGWCKVGYKGVTGWVNCKFLEESTECE